MLSEGGASVMDCQVKEAKCNFLQNRLQRFDSSTSCQLDRVERTTDNRQYGDLKGGSRGESLHNA